MSDKCDNKLTMYASEKNIIKFKESYSMKVGELWFDRYYIWRVEEEEGEATYEFQSSWEPPIKLLRDVSEEFPEALFKLEFESFMKFEGVAYIMDGEISMCRNDQFGRQPLR